MNANMGRVALALASAAVLLHAVETRTWTHSEASEFEKGTQTYKTTSKGLQFLKTYSQIGGLIISDTGEK